MFKSSYLFKLIGVQLAMTTIIAPVIALSDSHSPSESRALRESSRSGIRRNEQGDILLGKVVAACSCLNHKVTDDAGKAYGTCEDLLLDLNNGYVDFIWLRTGSESNSHVLLPFSLVSLKGDTLILNAEAAAKLSSATRREGELPKELTHAEEIASFAHFGLQPEWMDTQAARNWGSESNYGKLFKGGDLQQFAGTVRSVEQVTPLPGMAAGTQVIIDTESGPIRVQLAPRSYLARHSTPFRTGEKISITGSQAEVGGHRVVIASDVHRGPRTLRLRTPAGAVAWARSPQEKDASMLTAASTLRGAKVTNRKSEALGTIADIAVAAEHEGRIAYAIFSTPDRSPKQYPIPLGAFIVESPGMNWKLDLPKDLLENTPAFESSRLPSQVGAAWEEYTHVRFGRSALDGIHGETREMARQPAKG